jgi:site-specific DNA-methyltransferase (adenine-specific)
VKPVALMRWLTRLACPEHGLVVDPFAGSGSTGVAALAEHRRFLGIEQDPGYARIARARLRHAAAQVAHERPGVRGRLVGAR